MVYCGKPSKGCQACRDRKTRCDKQTPSCGQCIRANRTCPGYRSELDLMFRNESEAVIGKAKARAKNKLKPTSSPPIETFKHVPEADKVMKLESEWEGFSMFRDTHEDTFIQTMLPSCNMFPTLDERGLAYFSNLSPTWLRDSSLLDGISNHGNTEKHLLASMSAVGLASFSNSIHAPELMVRARRNYVNALQLTNAALRSPTEAKKDSTLFAVMILGIFETITGNNMRSLAAWTEHINGAAALVKLRGRDQFKSPAGQRMFLQVTGSLMLSCVQRTVAMPQHILDLRREAAKFLDADQPGWRITSVIIDFTIFRAAVRDCRIVGPKAVIEAALEVDRKFLDIVNDLPENYKYKTVYTDETPHLIWNGSYHVYKEPWMSHIYNGMRTCRVILHEIIRDQLLSASTAMTPIFPIVEMIRLGESSVAIMMEMQADILASIPQHTPSKKFGSEPSLMEGSRSYFVLWPLYLVGSMDLTTGPIREWAIARLRDIGENVGIRQALVVAEYLEKQTHIDIWDTKPDPEPHWKNQPLEEQSYPEEPNPMLQEMDHHELFQSHIHDDFATGTQT